MQHLLYYAGRIGWLAEFASFFDQPQGNRFGKRFFLSKERDDVVSGFASMKWGISLPASPPRTTYSSLDVRFRYPWTTGQRMMSLMSETAEPIYSDLGGDAELSELVEMFVEELPRRIETLSTAFAHGDLQTVQRSAHQLKGAVGSYGFHPLTPLAAAVEYAIRDGESETIVQTELAALLDACGRARLGVRH